MKYFVLVMLLATTSVQAETETLLLLPGDVSIMDLGNITPADLGSVTASDLAVTPALPLPANQPLSEVLEDEPL